MLDQKVLAKIARADFGHDGDGRFGLSLTFTGSGIGTGTFAGNWATYPERAQYSKENWERGFLDAVFLIRDTLTKANRRYASELIGIPVELTFDGNMLASWRVLEEVI